MIPIYVINLNRSQERMSRMSGLLKHFGLDCSRVAAVDGALLTPESFNDVIDLASETPVPTPGQVGCFLSHRRVWEIIAAGEANHGIVLEDDVVFAKNFGELIADRRLLHPEAGIIRLEGWPGKVWAKASVQELELGYNLHPLTWTTYGTAAYIISKACAADLVDVAKHYTHPIDVMLFARSNPLFGRIRAQALIPAPCYQYAFGAFGEDFEFLRSGIVSMRQPEPSRKGWVSTAKRRVSRTINHLLKRARGLRHLPIDLHEVGPLQVDAALDHSFPTANQKASRFSADH